MPDGTSSSSSSATTLHEIKISELPVAPAVSDTDQLEANQAGTSRSITVGQVKARVGADLVLTGHPTAPTPPPGDDDSSIPTTGWVQDEIDSSIAAIPGLINVGDYGAVGDGVTNDTAALQAALDFAAAQGGGTVLLGPKRYLIDSADLVVPAAVTVRGPWLMPGPGESGTFDPTAAKGALIVNPTYTIRLFGAGAAIERVMVLRKGLVNPAGDLATKFAMLRSFAGVGVTIGNGTVRCHDTSIRNVLIGGFDTGIYSDNNARMRIDHAFGDNNNGLFITRCTDMDYIGNVHMWPFLTSGAVLTTYTVSNVTNAGGLIQITTTAPHIFQTGDKSVIVADVVGVTAANGTWTVTRVDATNFTLQGSVFAGAYTSGGTVKAIPFFRSGVGFNLDDTTDWGQLTTCFAYAYGIGFRVFNSNHVTLNNCGTDAYALAYNTSTVGMYVTGTSSATTLLGCKTSAQGTGLKVDTTSSLSDQINVVGHRFWGNNVYAAQLLDANTTFNGISVQDRDDINKFYGTMYIGNSVGAVTFVGGDLGANNVFAFQSTSSPRPIILATNAADNVLRGAGQATSNVTTASSLGATLYIQDTGAVVGNGGAVQFGASQGAFAVVKGHIQSGANNTAGDVVISTRRVNSDPTLTETLRVGFGGSVTTAGLLFTNGTVAIGAGVATQAFVRSSTTTALGIYYGTGAPAFTAGKGSIYTQTDATTTTTRLWVNTTGSTTWAFLTTSA